MITKKITFSKNAYLILYKLLHDVLLLALLTFSGMLIAEGVLHGIISSHISFDRVAMFIFVILLCITWIGSKFQITYPSPKIKRSKILPFLILISFLLIGNSMLKFALWENITITLTALLVFFLMYGLLFSQTD